MSPTAVVAHFATEDDFRAAFQEQLTAVRLQAAQKWRAVGRPGAAEQAVILTITHDETKPCERPPATGCRWNSKLTSQQILESAMTRRLYADHELLGHRPTSRTVWTTRQPSRPAR